MAIRSSARVRSCGEKGGRGGARAREKNGEEQGELVRRGGLLIFPDSTASSGRRGARASVAMVSVAGTETTTGRFCSPPPGSFVETRKPVLVPLFFCFIIKTFSKTII